MISCLITYTSSPKIWLTGETASYLIEKWRDEVLKIGKFSNSVDVSTKQPNKHKTEGKIVFRDMNFSKAPQAYQFLRDTSLVLHFLFIKEILSFWTMWSVYHTTVATLVNQAYNVQNHLKCRPKRITVTLACFNSSSANSTRFFLNAATLLVLKSISSTENKNELINSIPATDFSY